MDKELLISAVFEKIPIWDKRHKLHSNRNVVDKYWREISAVMKEDEAKVKKQWKYLRDQFSVELGKHLPLRSAEDTPTSKWPYFTQLLFLRDIVKPRTTSGNLSHTQSTQVTYREETQSSAECDENRGNEEACQTNEQESVVENCITLPSASSQTTPIPTPVTAKKRRGITDTYQDSMLEIERRKVEYLESKAKRNCFTNQEDEHLSFFRSLLPHVRKIPENKVLSFRCHVQELVDQFSYHPNIFSPQSSSMSSHSSVPSSGYHNIDQNEHSSFPSSQQSILFEGHHDNTIPHWS